MKLTRWRAGTTLLALAMLVPLAAGCGSDGPSVTDANGCKVPTTVRIGWTPYLSWLPLVAAQDEGYFKDAGVNVKIVDFAGGGTEVTAAMLAGSVDFVATSAERPLLLAKQGVGIKDVVALINAQALGVVATKESGIVKGDVQSLRGKKIGITAPGSGTDQTLHMLLQESGIDPEKDLHIIATGGTTESIAALENHTVDAIVNAEPAISQLVSNPDNILALYLPTDASDAVAGWTFGALQTTDKYIADHACVVEKVVAGLSRGANVLTGDKELSMKTAASVFGDIDPGVLDSALERLMPYFSPEITDEMAQHVIDGMDTLGVVSANDYKVSDVYTDQFAKSWTTGK